MGVKKCPGSGSISTLPCKTGAEFEVISKYATAECCDESGEKCVNGIPSTCNPGCAAILVPAVRQCTAKGGFFEQPRQRATKAVFVKASTLCNGDSLSDPPCHDVNDFSDISGYVYKECCDEKAERCRNGLP